MIDFWLCDDAKRWIKQRIKPHFDGFEWGSGYSTVWLGQHCRLLVSVENRLDWFNRIERILAKEKIRTVELCYEPLLEDYVERINYYPEGYFDYVFIDGFRESRAPCVAVGWSKVKLGGMLIFDDSEARAYRAAVRLLDEKSDNRLDFSGPVLNPWNENYGWSQTSVWVK